MCASSTRSFRSAPAKVWVQPVRHIQFVFRAMSVLPITVVVALCRVIKCSRSLRCRRSRGVES
ncbi:hypothetical protein BU23DRAFT_638293 [Bimuria novae-zelandiae CBS 107.79]|uniref:Uncharacterized protein n=1 Tax=Bimuria novae-zelandiae CBS 107.79 TaxID=1447943 RepID=A0A6A5VAJ5_9PLEO|nr:hypothetical protein BU23DRAFT_638293 [Bimuria novae-zelandiae CBS 107.79]